MSKSETSRRTLLSASVTGIVSGFAATALGSPAARADAACGGLSREQYQEYLDLFNKGDPTFIKFYAPDVVFDLGTQQIKTAEGIRDFYEPVHAHIHETVTVSQFVSDATGIAVEMPTEFKVYKDWENGFFQRPLKTGEVMRTISFVLYTVENRKFKHIKVARYKQINDWRMES
jgi:hypothetical protein